MNEELLYADVIIPLNLADTYTYSVPDKFKPVIKIGMRVLVQFGRKRIYTGIVKNIHENKPELYETKEIHEILDSTPIVNQLQLRFWDWIASYYMCSIGEVFRAALPAGLKLESETNVFLQADSENIKDLNQREEQLLNVLKKEKVLSITKINSLLEQKQSITLVKSLIEKGAVYVEERLRKSYKPKTEKYIRLDKEINSEEQIQEIFDKLGRAKAQLKLMMAYISLSKCFSDFKIVEVPKKLLLEKSGVSSAILQSLIKKSYLEEYTKVVGRLPEDDYNTKELAVLNNAQQNAFKEIKQHFKTKDIVLLHGITSSGKTELYIHLIAETLKKEKQVLYLLPEIALTAQIINRLKEVFGKDIGIYHSKFSDSERVEVWLKVQKPNYNDSYKIILGVRSSIFLPFNNLGLIIVDEEHENSYKQYSPAPRYNARDLATVLAKLHEAKTLLGSATPSLESYYNVETNKYGLVELLTRYRDIQMPEIIIADMLTARKKKQMKSLFTPELIDNIGITLSENKQVILFQNRRGFSPYIECADCGWIPNCKHCDVSLTYHMKSNNLVCHYCGYTHAMISECPACGNINLQTKGFGTEKVEDEIKLFFPKARLLRMDLDSTRSKHGYEKIISAFETGKVDILIGTQMVTKGLDFDHVSLVGILNADNMLNFPDFRAFERSFQLMSQVSGRAGRKHKRGKVIIQVTNPKHQIIKDVVENNYKNMYYQQIQERKNYKYPPFYRIIEITVKHKDYNKTNSASKVLASILKSHFGSNILGPESPLINRIQNYFIKKIIVKIPRSQTVSRNKFMILKAGKYVNTNKNYKDVKIVFNVDPL